METQYISLNMTPSGVNPIFHISQYDVGRLLGFYVYNGSEVVDLDDYTCTVEATRTDGTQITTNVITNNNSGIFAVTATMSNAADKYNCQLVIVDGNANRVASLPFIMDVVTAALNGNDSSIYDDRSLYQQYNASMQAALANEATIRANADVLEAATRANAITAEETARQNADNTLQGNINSEAATRASADSNLQSQINQIIAPSGEAPSAAEVQNARIGADGVTYDTLGDAIRTQVSDLKSAINQSVTTDAKLFSKVAEHKSIELPITWVQGVWGASGASEMSTRIRSANLYTYDEEITFKVRNAGTGTVAYTKYSDNGHTRVDTGYVSSSITLDAGYYYGFWMQALNQTSDILPSAGDAVSFCLGITNGHAVFIGDSYTEGVGLDSSSDRWSTKLCASLGLTEHNYAVGGTGFYVGNNNNTDFIHQASNAINDTSFRNVDVKYVFIAGGRNDGSNSTAMTYSLSQVQSLVSALIDGVQSHFPNATIILIPMMFDADIIPQYIFSWYQKIILSCRSFYRNVRIVKGAYTWLTGSFGFIQNDGIHPNSAGHNIIATNVIDCLNGGNGQNNIGEYTIAYNQSAINNNPTMGVICDGKKVYLQSSLIRTTNTVAPGTPLFTETYDTTFIIGWCKPQKIYFTIHNIENGQSYSVYFTMSKTSTSYTASLIANESIPLGKYCLYGEYDFGRYLNVATGN